MADEANGVAEPVRVDAGDLVVGDVVRLNGAGPTLTVVAVGWGNRVQDCTRPVGEQVIQVTKESVGVQWFDAAGVLRSALVPTKAVTKVDRDKLVVSNYLFGALRGYANGGGFW